MINNTLKQPINNNLKESLINNNLKQSVVNNILKEPTISNKESLINDIFNETTNNKELLVNDILDKPKVKNNLEEPKINKETTINNNLKEPKINKNFEELKIKKKESTLVKTPEFLKSKRAILNPQNNDNKSFEYSITLSLYQEQIGKNYNRVPNIKPYINSFNWENINFPPT